MKIGIIFADEGEFIPFEKWAKENGALARTCFGHKCIYTKYKNKDIIGIESGIGKVNAATAASFLVFKEGVDIILNAGLSASVGGGERASIFAGSSYVECDFNISPTGRKIGEKPNQAHLYFADEGLLSKALTISGIKSAPFGTGDFFLTSKEKADMFYKEFSISAFDMESAAIASVCHFNDLPFLSVRKMSDSGDEQALEEYRDMNEKAEDDLIKILLDLISKID